MNGREGTQFSDFFCFFRNYYAINSYIQSTARPFLKLSVYYFAKTDKFSLLCNVMART